MSFPDLVYFGPLNSEQAGVIFMKHYIWSKLWEQRIQYLSYMWVVKVD